MFAQSIATVEDVRATLGTVLRGRREVVALSLTQVARRAGFSPAHLSEVERGQKEISTPLLLEVAAALEVRIGEVYQELGRRLGASDAGPAGAWPEDARGQLQAAAARLAPDALRSVAQYSLFLAMTDAEPVRPRIGFAVPARPRPGPGQEDPP
ncbi:MAG: helix-turn-helix domain-containing protein [Candidatus Dormibacterales bacterium]